VTPVHDVLLDAGLHVAFIALLGVAVVTGAAQLRTRSEWDLIHHEEALAGVQAALALVAVTDLVLTPTSRSPLTVVVAVAFLFGAGLSVVRATRLRADAPTGQLHQ
jgi:hypothetical protein